MILATIYCKHLLSSSFSRCINPPTPVGGASAGASCAGAGSAATGATYGHKDDVAEWRVIWHQKDKKSATLMTHEGQCQLLVYKFTKQQTVETILNLLIIFRPLFWDNINPLCRSQNMPALRQAQAGKVVPWVDKTTETVLGSRSAGCFLQRIS